MKVTKLILILAVLGEWQSILVAQTSESSKNKPDSTEPSSILQLATKLPTEADFPVVLKFLLAENAKSYEKVKWISFHSQQHNIDYIRGNRTFDRSSDWIVKFPYRYVLASTSQHDASGNAVPGQEATFKSVFGSEYFGFASHFEPNPAMPAGLHQTDIPVECFGYDSIDRVPSKIKSYITESEGANPLQVSCFGIEGARLDAFFLTHGNEFNVIEAKINAGHIFTVDCRANIFAQGKQLIATVDFDASRGFLISHCALYLGNHLLREFSSTTIGIIGEKEETVFVPTEIRRTDYENDKPSNAYFFNLSDFKLKPEIPPNQFTLQALGVADGQKVLYQSSTSLLQGKVWDNGNLIPDLTVKEHPGASQANLAPLVERNIIIPEDIMVVPTERGYPIKRLLIRVVVAAGIASVISAITFLAIYVAKKITY